GGGWEEVGARGDGGEVGVQGQGKNRDGVGARVEVTTKSGRQLRENWLARGYLSGQEPRVHFGLGDDDRVQKLVVRWPSGRVQEFADLPADQVHTVTEPQAPVAGFPPPPPAPAGLFAPRADGPAFTHRDRPLDAYQRQPAL